jgi:ParB family chromosome partitioning protein
VRHDYFNLEAENMTKANVVKMDPRVKAFPSVSMLPLSSLKPASEAPKEMGLQVRKGGDTEGLPTLEASVRVHGIIVPLVVRLSAGHVYVVAGNRRLKVLKQIHGDIDVMVPVVEAGDFDGDTREIAMATNVALPPHPVDRYEVIAQLVAEGMTPVDAMQRFGMSERQYAQTMKLGQLTPMIRDAWREGKITGETAQAFTLAGSEQEQEKIYQRVLKDSWDKKVSAHEVRRRLIPESQREVGALVEFVGVEACEKLSLLKQRDWFSTGHIVADVKGLKKVASEKLDMVQDSLIRDGWKFAEMRDAIQNSYAYGRETPDKMGAFTKAQKERSGCFLRIGEDGKLEIDFGRIEPRKAEKAKGKAKPKGAEKAEALRQRLQDQLRAAGADALKFDHAVAVSAMIAAFASGGDVLAVTVGRPMEKKPLAFKDTFETALKASPEQRAMMLGQIAAHALDPCDIEDKGVAALFTAMKESGKHVVAHFDAKDYFESVPLALIVAAVKEVIAGQAPIVAKMKKADAVKFAVENLKGWLPKELRTAHYRKAKQ